MNKNNPKREIYKKPWFWIWIFVVTILVLTLSFFISLIVSHKTGCVQFGLDEGSKGYVDSLSCSFIVFPYRIMSPIFFHSPEPDPELSYSCLTSRDSIACKNCIEDGLEGEICTKCNELLQIQTTLTEEQNNYLDTKCINR